MHQINHINNSYQPIPLFEDYHGISSHFSPKSAVQYKMDLNLYCIKKPQQTFFIRVTNPDLLAWGIDDGDMLVVEKTNKIQKDDLVVIEHEQGLAFYHIFLCNDDKIVLFALDSKQPNITVSCIAELNISGVVTNTIHQFRGRSRKIA